MIAYGAERFIMPIPVTSEAIQRLDLSICCVNTFPAIIADGKALSIAKYFRFYFSVEEKGGQQNANLSPSGSTDGQTVVIQVVADADRFFGEMALEFRSGLLGSALQGDAFPDHIRFRGKVPFSISKKAGADRKSHRLLQV